MKYSQRIGTILSKARYQTNKSQEFMALELGVSKNTVVNWEKGTSSPKISQFFEWFNVLGINAHRPIMDILYPEKVNGLEPNKADEYIKEALIEFINSSDGNIIRQIAFLLLGEHGSEPNAVLNCITAYLHLPLSYRVIVSHAVCDAYEICDSQDKLIRLENIMPDVEMLHKSLAHGKEAAMNGLAGYTIQEDSDAN